MGLFDFVRDAGENLLKKVGVGDDPDTGDVIAKIQEHGLVVKGLSVRVAGDVAMVGGEVADQETREKVILVVGNVKGIAAVDDQLSIVLPELPEVPAPETAPAPEPEAAVFYTVVRGDTLGKIAKAHYGNAMKYPVIFEANKPMLTDPDRIYPGQVLRIPPLAVS
ncbi:MAG: peptidoglycan-binding protein LysM [Pseudomonadota bacterium]